MNKTGILSLLASAAIYGSFGILIKGIGTEMSVNNQIIFRYGLAFLLMAGLITITKAKFRLSKDMIFPLGLFLILMQVSIWAFTKGAVVTTIPSLLGAFYIGSITTSIAIGGLFLKEKITVKNGVSSIFLILLIYILSGSSNNSTGLLWGLLSGGLENITQIMRGKLTHISKGLLSLSTLGGICVITIMQSLFFDPRITIPKETSTWIYGLIFAVLVILVNILVTLGFRKVAANIGSVLMASEIAFGTLLSYIFLGIKPRAIEILIGLAVITTIAIQNLQIKENNIVVKSIRNMLEE